MKVNKNNFHYVAKTFHGLEEVLERELIGLGASNTRILDQAVSFDGDKALMYAANFRCRTALQIQRHITSFSFNSENEFYRILNELRWEQYIKPEQVMCVVASTDDSYQGQNRKIEMATKDAVQERFRSIYGVKPAYSSNNYDLQIIIRIEEDICIVSANSSGDPLNKRGYQVSKTENALNEVLAAGVVILSGWDQKSDFFDPLCGSGTLLIEAAMVANNIPSGTFRQDYGFKHWKDFDQNLLQKVMDDGFNEQTEADIQIIGSDPNEENIALAAENIRNAKLHKDIFLSHTLLEELDPDIDKPGIVMTNLPVAKDPESDEEVKSLYVKIGDHLKKKFDGFHLWILCTDPEALNQINLKSTKKLVLLRDAVEFHLEKFELTEDSVRTDVPKVTDLN
ncbi:MAG: N-6 DNA methylase [Bacteroidota bacterium]|nr:N-6 DNA methylase [Bacteroidota bacterium]